ncbi:pentapeptide repeat-containing protein [Undibacterium sp. Ji50W]|uniref:pentapeptide repeat-containing protein n=1 Tax=Undibacterium sp. Ji50W TaxID=3413041 RepID=UPI003BEF6944
MAEGKNQGIAALNDQDYPLQLAMGNLIPRMISIHMTRHAMEDNKLLQGRNFHNVDLANSNFDQVQLRASSFHSVDMEACRFRDISFVNVTMEACDFTGMRIDGVLVSDMLQAYEESKKK